MFTELLASIKASGKTLDSMDELLLAELKDLYDAESRIIDALPKMEAAASSPQIKQAFRSHLGQTKRQKERLEQIFRMLDKNAERSTCEGMKGLIEEGAIITKAKGDAKVKDAALIAAAQRVEHYEMAAYGSARAFAQQLGRSDVANLLQMTLNEEGQTDHELTQVAESSINPQATRSDRDLPPDSPII